MVRGQLQRLNRWLIETHKTSVWFCVLQKEALMEQVAHQAVVMQFILEMASNSQQDPRGCFRQFFHKAKVRRKHLINTVCECTAPSFVPICGFNSVVCRSIYIYGKALCLIQI